MIFKTVVLLTIIAISGAIQPDSREDEEGPDSFDRYKAVEHFSNKDHYSSYKDYDKHKKKDYYDKKNKYYEEGKPYKKQKYYKDVNEKPYKEKNYKKHWEDREFSKNNENEYRRNTNYMDFNEIDSNDFQKNKFSKYDKHAKHPNHFEDTRKYEDVDQHDKYQKTEKYYEHDKHQKSEKYYEPEKHQRDEKYYEPEKHQRNEKYYEPEKHQRNEKYYEPEKHQRNEKYEHDRNHKEKPYAQYREHPKQKYDLASDTDVNYLRHIPNNPDSEFIEVKNPEKYEKTKENFQPNYQNENEMHLKRVKKDFYKDLKILDLSNPPPSNETVLMARYIIHNVDWAALATVSARSPTKGTPFANIKSVSDGPVNKGSGVPFFYLTPRDLSSEDLNKDNRCTVTVTLAETSYCRSKNFDPEDPRCARLILSGKIKRIREGTPEEDFAKEALFTRHPAMSTWPADHEWFFAKLKIGQIVLLDQFGGPKYIDVQEYLNVEPPKKT